jgi:hypothetical protein
VGIDPCQPVELGDPDAGNVSGLVLGSILGEIAKVLEEVLRSVEEVCVAIPANDDRSQFGYLATANTSIPQTGQRSRSPGLGSLCGGAADVPPESSISTPSVISNQRLNVITVFAAASLE